MKKIKTFSVSFFCLLLIAQCNKDADIKPTLKTEAKPLVDTNQLQNKWWYVYTPYISDGAKFFPDRTYYLAGHSTPCGTWEWRDSFVLVTILFSDTSKQGWMQVSELNEHYLKGTVLRSESAAIGMVCEFDTIHH